MAEPMTREQARAWKERWRVVNRLDRDDVRATSPEAKFRSTAGLMATGQQFGWTQRSSNELTEVRSRWLRLKRHYGG